MSEMPATEIVESEIEKILSWYVSDDWEENRRLAVWDLVIEANELAEKGKDGYRHKLALAQRVSRMNIDGSRPQDDYSWLNDTAKVVEKKYTEAKIPA